MCASSDIASGSHVRAYKMLYYDLALLLVLVKTDFATADDSDEVLFRPSLRRPSLSVYSECLTPHDKAGTCVELTSCSTLYHLMLTRGKESSVASFLRMSQCGLTYDKKPKVCCPPYQHTAGTQSSVTRPSSTLPPPPAPPPPRTSRPFSKTDSAECGRTIREYSSKIVGGSNASLGDWPWMVALAYTTPYAPNKPEFKCGATLISSKWVVTAAHCVTSLGAYGLTSVRLGDLDLNSNVQDGANPIEIEVDTIISHPEYSQTPILNDIALVKLKHSVKFSKHIRPICLLSGPEFKSDSFYQRKKPFIIGFGAVMWRGPTATRLQETSIAIIESSKCANAYVTIKNAKIDESVLCAGEPGKDTCQGDSGGPLIFPIQEGTTTYKYYLGGVVSYGIRCADPNFPGVYTRIAAFTDWIHQTTGLKF